MSSPLILPPARLGEAESDSNKGGGDIASGGEEGADDDKCEEALAGAMAQRSLGPGRIARAGAWQTREQVGHLFYSGRCLPRIPNHTGARPAVFARLASLLHPACLP